MVKSSQYVDQALIRDLANLLTETNLSEIEVEQGQQLRIRVARHSSAVEQKQATAQPVIQQTADPASEFPSSDSLPHDPAKHPGILTSPMVGTAYHAPEPGAPPFVKLGSSVKTGQNLLIIEAMKTMNLITATRDGTVTKILFDDGQPVEYGEPLLIID